MDLNIKCGTCEISTGYRGYGHLDLDLTDVDTSFINNEIIETIGFEDYIAVHGIEALTEHLKKYYTFSKYELTITD
jgi:hypothetical protein